MVVGLGQDAAGDDGVGLAVARALAAAGGEARACADASIVVGLLAEGRRVVIVDAVVGGGPVGAIVELAADALATAGAAPLSSHGLGVAEAIDVARTLLGDEVARAVAIVGVVIAPPARGALGLSAAVAAAVAPAAALAAALATGSDQAAAASS